MREIRGFDISGWNTVVNYQSVKDLGVEFAVLKIMRQDCKVDKGFEKHLAGCRKVGIRATDVYTYSYATTIVQAQKFAKNVLILLKSMICQRIQLCGLTLRINVSRNLDVI